MLLLPPVVAVIVAFVTIVQIVARRHCRRLIILKTKMPMDSDDKAQDERE